MVEVLSAFPARPPTPPKASHIHFMRDGEHLPGRPNMLDTPGESPSSTAESAVLRSNKKVNFSPIPSYIKPPTFSNHTSIPTDGIRSLPPSNECKPTKSILKATSAVLSIGEMASEESQPQSFTVLLESTTQQLAGESLSSRVDAYMQILGALKAYENIPAQESMVSKLGLLLQFIQRDISRDLGKGDLVEMNLISNALKLVLYVIWSEKLASQMPDEFKIFIIDHSLSVLQESKLPKSILNHYMHILYTQNFPAKTMTNSRITRILAVLSDITDRVSGNGIVSHRLGVYTRLLGQSKTVMSSQAPLWMEHCISGLLHTMKDVRAKALILGNQTAMSLGPNLNVSKSTLDIFNKELSEGRKIGSEICDRMSRMTKSVDSGVHVPQIWSIIILLLRSKRFNIEHWDFFKQWVLVIQRCFNCSEQAIKSQAIVAWNKFVYVVSCNDSTSTGMLKMLTKPILSHTERKRNEKAATQTTPLFLSSYYNLVYYAFQPSIPYDHIDLIWEEYISQPFANHFSSNTPLQNDAACKVLTSLSWTPQAKVWTENKINEGTRMEADYIVPIDCRWIRSRVTAVVGAFEVLLASSTWLPGNYEDSPIAIAWTHICKAIADASSKEIKPSTELVQAIGTILGLFQRLRLTAPASLNAETTQDFLERFSLLSATLISTIGPSALTEKMLFKNSKEAFQAATTPTHRRSPTDGNIDTPFMHILRMTSSLGKLSEPNKSSLRLVDNLLETASKGRQSRGSRLDFLEKCTEIGLDENEENEPTSLLDSYVWEATARLAKDCLASLPMESLRERDGTLARDYSNITSILLRGLKFSTTSTTWSSLLDAYARVIRTERGERGILNLVIEPIANQLLQLHCEQICLPLTALINQASSLSYYQQKKSAGTPNGSNYGSVASPSDKLTELLNKFLTEAYDHFIASKSSALAEVIESLASILGCGPLQFRFMLLEKLQQALALWLRDPTRCLTSENGADSRLITACRTLTLAIANVIHIAVPHNTESLHTFEIIVSAGLESVHKSTANRFIEMWNATFGLQEPITYPLGVQIALQKLVPFVELQLPSPLPSQVESQELEMPDFVESQETGPSESIVNPFGKDIKRIDRGLSRPTTFSSSPIIQSTESGEGRVPPNNILDSTPRRRLRHEDSQIQFVAVDSSPRSSDVESQFLTERQREVKERQHGETSRFLEGLRSSSPALSYPEGDSGVLSPVQLPKTRETVRDMDAPLTPTLAANLQDDDDFPGSSPTPATKDQTSLQNKKPSSLTIPALEVANSDPPSSPPEIASSHSPRNERVTRRTTLLQKSEPKIPLKIDLKAESSNELRRSPRVSASRAAEHPVLQTALSDIQTDTSTTVLASKNHDEPGADDTPIDTIPDTYTDEFEQLLASQLEQDLELAVDLTDKLDTQSIQSTQSSDASLPSGPVTRKRKRDAEAEETPSPERTTRRSRRSKAPRWNNSQNESPQPETEVPKPATPQASILRRGLSTPQSSPLKHHISIDDLSSDNATNSGSTRRSLRTNREIVSSPIKPKSPELRRRRSTRLSGAPALSPPKSEKLMPGASKNGKKRSLQNSNAKENDPESPEKAFEAVPVQDVEMENIDQEAAVPHPESTEAQNVSTSEEINITAEITAEGLTREQNISVEEGQKDLGEIVENDIVMEDKPAEQADFPSLVTPNQKEKENEEEQFSRYLSQAVQTENIMENSDAPAPDPTAGILGSLRRVLTDIKNARFGRGVLREIDDALFDIRVEAHQAARRSDL